jgi:nicotinate (nicotinamide) nucleotide adenylyltransferase
MNRQSQLKLIAGLSFVGSMSWYCWKVRTRDEIVAKNDKRSIAIFGLSANPPTGRSGHQGIVKHLVKTERFDEIWILPVYHHILKTGVKMASFEDRVQMCKIAFEVDSTPRTTVKVLEMEKEVYSKVNHDPNNNHIRVGTIDILRHIHEEHPQYNLVLVLGGDTFFDLSTGKWKEYESIPELAQLFVFQRKGGASSDRSDDFKRKFSERIIQTHHSMPKRGVSSTKLRESKPWESRTASEEEIDPLVVQYIQENHLYSDEI